MVRGKLYDVPIAFFCAKCGDGLSSARNLTRHLSNQHNTNIAKIKEFSSENTIITDYTNSNFIYPCIVCGATTNTLDELKKHCKEICFKYAASPEKEVDRPRETRDFIHWTTEQVTIFFTTTPANQEYTLNDAEAYFTPSPLKASQVLSKNIGKTRALNLNLPMRKKPELILDSSESSLLPLSLKKVLNVNDSEAYSLLSADIDISAMFSSGITDEGLYNIVHGYALMLNECILNNNDLLICVFSWDIYIIEAIAGDSCAHKRGDEWMETDRAQVFFVRKQEYQGSPFFNNLEIRWGPLTFVAVGLLYFDKTSLDFKMKGSLGSSTPKEILPFWNRHFDIHIRKDPSSAIDGFRHLWDFRKPSAAFKWSFTSTTLIKKGIFPVHSSQLWKLHGDNQLAPKKADAISLIIECYTTGKCSERQAGFINNVLQNKTITLPSNIRSVLKFIATNADSDVSIKDIITRKLNLLTQFESSNLYAAVEKANSEILTVFINKQ